MKSLVLNIKNKMGFLGAIIIAAVVGGLSVTAVQAAIPDSSGLIHGCYKNSTGTLKIIDSSSSSCASGETSLNWSQSPGKPGNNGQPLTCPGCDFSNANNRFTGHDLSNAFLTATVWNSIDLSGANLDGADLFGSNLSSTNLTNASLIGTNVSGVAAISSNFLDANLTNANLSDSNFGDAVNMNTAILTGVTWSSGATCPDNTISGDHSNTCIGHLVP